MAGDTILQTECSYTERGQKSDNVKKNNVMSEALLSTSSALLSSNVISWTFIDQWHVVL